MDCIVLAGGCPQQGDPLWEETRGRRKAMLAIAGRPMIAWVVDALRGSRHIDRIIVVGLDEPVDLAEGAQRLPDHGSLIGNLYAGIALLSAVGPAVYCWSDIPLATPAMFDRFIEAATDPELDVNAGLVARTLLQGRYPDAHDLWLGLAEGEFIAADFGLFHPRQAARLRPQLDVLAPHRKSAVRQAFHVGLPLLLRYVTGRLSIAQLERHLERRYAMRCRVRIVDDPELGLDVDSPGNLAICRRVLEAR